MSNARRYKLDCALALFEKARTLKVEGTCIKLLCCHGILEPSFGPTKNLFILFSSFGTGQNFYIKFKFVFPTVLGKTPRIGQN